MLYLTTQDMHHSIPLDFDIHGAQYHDMIFNQCIDILPYRYVLQIPRLQHILIWFVLSSMPPYVNNVDYSASIYGLLSFHIWFVNSYGRQSRYLLFDSDMK